MVNDGLRNHIYIYDYKWKDPTISQLIIKDVLGLFDVIHQDDLQPHDKNQRSWRYNGYNRACNGNRI